MTSSSHNSASVARFIVKELRPYSVAESDGNATFYRAAYFNL